MELNGGHISVERDKNRYFFFVMLRDNSSDHLLHISPWCERLPADADYESIGKVILRAVKYIYENPDGFDMYVADKNGEYEKYERLRTEEYCSYSTFERRNVFGTVIPENDGTFTIYSEACSSADVVGREYLGKDPAAAEIGRVLYISLAAAEDDKRKRRGVYPDPYPPEEIGLFGGGHIIVHPPHDKKFVDMGDCHSSDCYKFFGYCPKEDSQPAAAFFLTDAPGLAGLPDDDTIRSGWSGKPAYFSDNDSEAEVNISYGNYGIFTVRSEKNCGKIHRISYFAVVSDNDILECGMEINEPSRRKKTDERLTEMFGEFAGKIRFM